MHDLSILILQGFAAYFASRAIAAAFNWVDSKISRDDKETDFTLSD